MGAVTRRVAAWNNQFDLHFLLERAVITELRKSHALAAKSKSSKKISRKTGTALFVTAPKA